MESRLPKPSGLKRPAIRAMVPSDRLGTTTAPIHTQSAFPSVAKQPLAAIDVTNNVPFVVRQAKKRLASPEMRPKIERAKIRRSRSASEIHRNPTESAASSLLVTFPAKLCKSTTSLRTINQTGGVNAKPRQVPMMSRQTSQRPTSSVQKPAAGAVVRRPGAVTSSSSGPIKLAGGLKKIPAYDYKARFLDLQERYKTVKEKYDESQQQLAEFSTIGEQFEESQTKLFRCMDQLKNEESTVQCLRQQISSQEIKLDCLSKSFTAKLEENRCLKEDCDRLTTENMEMKPELLDLRQRCATLSSTNEQLNVNLLETEESLFRSNMERKELHNVVMDLRGNIRVFCRVRPALDMEDHRVLCGWQYLDDSSLEISCENAIIAGARKTQKHEFTFDQVFHQRSTQNDIFELVSPLIQSAMDGYNVCIFAYGQTGSGKTFTMDGVPDEIGIIPRTVDLLFNCIGNYRRLGWEYTIKVSNLLWLIIHSGSLENSFFKRRITCNFVSKTHLSKHKTCFPNHKNTSSQQ